MAEATEASGLLQRMGRGDELAAQELFLLVYEQLHALAGLMMGGERAEHTLQATALVHEAWLRLVGGRGAPGEELAPEQGRFLALAARAMRNVLVDHARRRRALKREGERIVLEEATVFLEDPGVDVLAVDEALGALERQDQELAWIVELRFFAGLAHGEIGRALALSERPR